MDKERCIYRLTNNKVLNEILLYGLIFSAVIFSRDTLISSVKIGFYKTFSIQVIILIISVSLLLFNNRGNILFKKNATREIGIFTFLIVITSLIKLDFQMYILSILFYIIMAYFFIYIFSFESFFKKLSNIMIFLGIISLICCYLLKPVLFPEGVRNGYLYIISNSSGLEFFDLGLSYVVAAPYYIRNFGLFREPGVYQFFLVVPLIYELLIEKKKKRIFNILLLMIAIFSTFSLTGIIVMSIIVIIYFLKLIVEGNMTKKIIIGLTISAIMAGGILCTLYFANSNFQSIVNESIAKLFSVNESTNARGGSLVTNIKLFLQSMIWGNNFSVVQYASAHNTNSTFSLFAIFGIFVGSLSVWYHYLFTKMISDKIIIKIIMLGAILILVNSQFFLGNCIFWIFIFTPFMDKECDIEY